VQAEQEEQQEVQHRQLIARQVKILKSQRTTKVSTPTTTELTLADFWRISMTAAAAATAKAAAAAGAAAAAAAAGGPLRV